MPFAGASLTPAAHTHTHTINGKQKAQTLLTWLNVPRTNIRLGDRSFLVTGPRMWNSLPTSLRV